MKTLGPVIANELDYELPESLIADAPLQERDASRLLVLNRHAMGVSHDVVKSLAALVPHSLFVFNDTRVLPARLHATKKSGGKVEILLVERLSARGREETWLALGRASKGLREGDTYRIDDTLSVTMRSPHGADGMYEVLVSASDDVEAALARVGEIPLPPYIRRKPDASDSERYQTVFARELGSVAAPTAGLHFTDELLSSLHAAGHQTARVTLHVGPGTFQPLRTDDLTQHVMHHENYEISEATAAAINAARAERRPVIAVGTTVVRTLEAAFQQHGAITTARGKTNIFIYPPFEFRVIEGLLTNFHLPRSTLLALVMAFSGIDEVRDAYAHAVREKYRFFSYGDAMLIRPSAP